MSAGGEQPKSQPDGKAAQSKMAEMGMMSYKVRRVHPRIYSRFSNISSYSALLSLLNRQCEAAGLTVYSLSSHLLLPPAGF